MDKQTSRSYMADVLARTIQPADTVVMNNLPGHKVSGIRLPVRPGLALGRGLRAPSSKLASLFIAAFVCLTPSRIGKLMKRSSQAPDSSATSHKNNKKTPAVLRCRMAPDAIDAPAPQRISAGPSLPHLSPNAYATQVSLPHSNMQQSWSVITCEVINLLYQQYCVGAPARGCGRIPARLCLSSSHIWLAIGFQPFKPLYNEFQMLANLKNRS